MLEIIDNALVFTFPEVHPKAQLAVSFMRTLRVPDNGKDHPLPTGLGQFPVQHVDDFADRVPAAWREHGGVMFPMYQSEALRLNFSGPYPFALKVAAGKINAITGEAWCPGLNRKPQDYLVQPKQFWLNGYTIAKGTVRQFIAEPIGPGYTAEEQITGVAKFGGIQLAAFPMKRSSYDRYFPPRPPAPEPVVSYSIGPRGDIRFSLRDDMGLAPGGLLREEVLEDAYSLDDWDTEHTSRCFVHLCNSLAWQKITGTKPPNAPPSAKDYKENELPWFECYRDGAKPLPGSALLAKLKSLTTFRRADA